MGAIGDGRKFAFISDDRQKVNCWGPGIIGIRFEGAHPLSWLAFIASS